MRLERKVGNAAWTATESQEMYYGTAECFRALWAAHVYEEILHEEKGFVRPPLGEHKLFEYNKMQPWKSYHKFESFFSS